MYQASQVYIVGSWKHAPSMHISSVYASGLYIVETIVETKMKLNLVVDKNSRKVLYAEAGKNFVDFLFNLLTLPVGTVIMQLTEKGMMGCLGDLYQSIENLSETYMQPNQSKPLLKPIFRTSYCTLPAPKKF